MVAIILNESFSDSVETYLSVNEWVSESEAPLVAGLIHVARLLDMQTRGGKELRVGLTMEFRMLFADLRKCKPEGASGVDIGDPFDKGLAKILGHDTTP